MIDETCTGKPFLDTAFFDFEYGDTSAGERIIDSQYISSTEYVSRTVLGVPPSGSQNNLPDLARASSILAISEDVLKAALGPPPPDLSVAARTLGIGEQDLIAALESVDNRSSGTAYTEGGWNQGNETVFGVNFADGRIKGYPRTIGPNLTNMFARYVRGNTAYGISNYNDNGDGTITDEATGLIWMKTDSNTALNWGNALAYCEAFDGSGHTDWRLPNAKELQSIVDYTRSPDTTSSAAIDPIFTTTSTLVENSEWDYPFYWTSTTHVNADGDGGWGVYVAFGKALGYMSNTWTDVHGAGAQRSDPKIGDPTAYAQGHGPQGDAVRINNYVRCVRAD